MQLIQQERLAQIRFLLVLQNRIHLKIEYNI